jgi:uncharacterized membrane protein YedE/YeeE
MSLEMFIWPVVGGVLIGLSAAVLMLTNGRVAGVSGIVASGLTMPRGDTMWRWMFVAGVLGGGFLAYGFAPSAFANTVPAPTLVVAAGGLLVGFGTRLGSGCTSGHGVCGLARFSPRSLVSVITFIGSGVLFVTLLRDHLV